MLSDLLGRLLRRRGGCYLGLAGLVCAALLQLVAPLDDHLYDLLIQSPRMSGDASRVVLGTFEPNEIPGTANWQPVMRQLARTGLKLVVLVEAPRPDATVQLPVLTAQSVGLVRQGGGQNPVWQTLGAAAPDSAIWCWPEPGVGVARRMPEQINLAGKLRPCIASVVAHQLLARPIGALDNAYGIDYRIAGNALPRISWARLTSGDYSASALQGRVLVLAPAVETRAAVAVPGSGNMQTTSVAEVQARAIDSLLRSSQVRFFAPWGIYLAGLALFLVAYFYLFPRFSAFGRLSVVAASALIVVGLSAAALFGGKLWLPPAFLMLALLAASWARQFDLRAHEQVLLRRLQRSFDSLSGRRAPASAAKQEVPHEQIVNFLVQCFDLQRCMLVRIAADGTSLEQVAMYNVEGEGFAGEWKLLANQIYTEALAEGKPIPLVEPLLSQQNADDPEEQEYVAALQNGGNLLGFWFYSLRREIVDSDRAPQGRELARIMAELTYAMQFSESETPTAAAPDALALAGSRSALARLHVSTERAMRGMESRFETFEDLFDNATTPAAVLDSFGRVRLANHAFEDLARRIKQPLLGYNTIEILTGCCNIEVARAREILRDVLLDGEGVDLLAEGLTLPDRYVLRVRPLRSGSAESARDAGRPFRLVGILLEFTGAVAVGRANELVDVAIVLQSAVLRWQERIPERNEAVELSCGAVGMTKVPADRLRVILRVIGEILLDDLLPDGHVKVSAIRVMLGAKRIVISAHNQGYGVPQWHIDALMSGQTDEAGGSIGKLAILRQELNRWDGDIEVTAQVASGFAITVSLPAV